MPIRSAPRRGRRPRRAWPLTKVVGTLDPILLGWRNYYRYATQVSGL
ncbi:hypothetical protein FJW08_23300 [Mesorhizobium sp. B3-2-1]|nr:hypothetical protein FJW08_23300 [Mesorhizobium sp. B3-2-1]